MDVFLSTTSNRLGVVTKQLAVIATVFSRSPSSPASSAKTSAGWWATSPAGRLPRPRNRVRTRGLVILLAFFKRRGWF
jgi:hypothetical protein